MNNQPFDLNDIENEPSDEQLHSLMNEVALKQVSVEIKRQTP